MNLFVQTIRYSFRVLLKSPSFSAVAIVTLALGIAANATIFSFINGLLFRPIDGIERPDRIVGVYTSDRSSGQYGGSSFPDFRDLRQQANTFADLAAYDTDSPILSGSDNVERLRASLVSTNYFQLLGVGAQLGRTIRPEDEGAGVTLAVLSHAFWQKHFGGDTSVIGKTITLNNKPFTIVGVASQHFKGLRLGSLPDVWLPLVPDPNFDSRGSRRIGIVGRLRDDSSLEQARAQVSAIAERLAQAYPETNMGTLAQPNAPRPMFVEREERVGPSRGGIVSVSVLLLIVVGVVLLIACANVANLTLARATVRRREIAIRLALGASRLRLIQQLLTESILLALFGGVAGLLITFWTADLIPKFFVPVGVTGLDASIDWRVLAFTAAVSLLTGIIFGLAPAWQSSNPAIVSTLKEETTTSSVRLNRIGLRSLLVTAQVALSLLLLVSSGLFLRSLRNAVTFDPGFDSHNLLLASLTTSGQGIDRAQTLTYYDELLAKLSSEPGVRSATLSVVVPLAGGGQRNNLVIEGYQPQPNEDLEINTNVVGLNYFQTLGITLLKGRDFAAGDRKGSAPVAIVNEEFVQRYFGGDGLGKHVRTDSEGPQLEIIGVVRTAKYRNLRESPLPFVFLPFAQNTQPDMTLVVSTHGDPAALKANVRSVAHSVNRNVPTHSIKTITEQIETSLAPERMLATLLAVFGAAALLLASVGIYGVVSYAVSQRTHEIGIRMALGARSTDVMNLIVRDGMVMVIAGVLIGLAGAFGLTRLVDSLLFGITPTDLPTFVMMTFGLVAVAFIACIVPARRATKVDPMEALRYE